MELRQLNYFLKAKAFLNFTEAAKKLYISQSTLSQQIKQLEDELGVPLFNRVGKRVTLTEAGALFAVYAERSLLAARDGKVLMQDLEQLRTGTLKIGLTWGLKSILLTAFQEFTVRFPLITIEITFGTTEELIQELLDQRIDFALTFYEEGEELLLEYQPIFQSDMALIVSASSSLANLDNIELKDIESLQLALPTKGFSTRKFLDQVFLQEGIVPDICVAINDTASLLELVRTGLFQTLLTRATLHGTSGLKALPILGVNMKRQAVIIKLKDTYEKKAAIAFKQILIHLNKEAYECF